MIYRRNLQKKFLYIVLGAYLCVSLAAIFVFYESLDAITQKLGREFAAQYALKEKAIISMPIRRELALALKMADTPLLRRWTLNEDLPELTNEALAELESYKNHFADKSYFFVVHRSGHYYFNDASGNFAGKELQYTIDPKASSDEWYFSTVGKVKDFALNVNYDKAVKETKIWINVVLRDKAEVLGLAGTGLSLDKFIGEFIANKKTGVLPILLDREGAIQAHPDPDLIDQSTISKSTGEKSTVFKLLSSEPDRAALRIALNELASSGKEVSLLRLNFPAGRTICAVSYIPEINWYVLILVDFREILSIRDFLPLILVSAISLLILAGAILIVLRRIVLGPLSSLTRYTKDVAAGKRNEPLPVLSHDELGELTESFNTMMQTIGEYTVDLENKVNARTKEIRNLFDNIGEGILSFGPDFRVETDYSRECESLFKQKISGTRIDQLLYPLDKAGAALFVKSLERFFATDDEFKQNVLLSLLPSEINIAERIIGVRFKPLERGKMMLILSDLTYSKVLETKIGAEQQILRFVVNSMTNRRYFLEVAEAYNDFLSGDRERVLSSHASPGTIASELFRSIHTFKGLFLQIDLIHTPAVLHRCEEKLAGLKAAGSAAPAAFSATPSLSLQDVRAAVDPAELEDAFAKDKAVLERYLGADFFSQRETYVIEPADLEALEKLAEKICASPSVPKELRLEKELEVIKKLRTVFIFDLFSSYPAHTLDLAEKREKLILPFSVEGRNFRVRRGKFDQLAMSFIHVFRNAVVHGIEGPEVRLRKQKPEEGRISFRIDYTDGEIILSASDDGKGLDMEAIRGLAEKKGLLSPANSGTMDQSVLIEALFRGGLSTQVKADLDAGRGFGLSALGREVDLLGGRITIKTVPEEGTEIEVRIPEQEVYL